MSRSAIRPPPLNLGWGKKNDTVIEGGCRKSEGSMTSHQLCSRKVCELFTARVNEPVLVGPCVSALHFPVASVSLRAKRVNVRFVRVLGRGKRIFKDSVRLIARFYSRSEYDKPFEC